MRSILGWINYGRNGVHAAFAHDSAWHASTLTEKILSLDFHFAANFMQDGCCRRRNRGGWSRWPVNCTSYQARMPAGRSAGETLKGLDIQGPPSLACGLFMRSQSLSKNM
jgi:hypothetical protein